MGFGDLTRRRRLLLSSPSSDLQAVGVRCISEELHLEEVLNLASYAMVEEKSDAVIASSGSNQQFQLSRTCISFSLDADHRRMATYSCSWERVINLWSRVLVAVGCLKDQRVKFPGRDLHWRTPPVIASNAPTSEVSWPGASVAYTSGPCIECRQLVTVLPCI